MAGAAASGGRRGSRRRGRRFRAVAEINVTPFVDVMLVLLIIFMVAAPLLTVGVLVDLPQTRANALKGDKEPLAITVTKNGEIFLQETAVSQEELVPRLTAIAAGGYEERIFIRGDQGAEYGKVIQVMSEVSRAGFTRLAIVTETPPSAPGGAAAPR